VADTVDRAGRRLGHARRIDRVIRAKRDSWEYIMLFRTTLWIGIVLSLTVSLGIADRAWAERRLALVIGNGDYVVGPLDNPTNDAALMAETLRAAGFEVTHLENLGYRDLQRAVVGFGRELRGAGDDTVGMVYYAGHAVQAEGENYLIPVDADIEDELDLRIATLDVSTMMASLDKAGNRMNMVILDACRNNPFKAMSRSGTRGLAKIDAASGTLLAYSTAPGDVAADGSGRNSPYTAALAKAIRTPGLPVEQVFKRVRIEVMERTGERQVPWESSSLTGDFVFTKAAPAVAAPEPTRAPAAPDNSAEIAFWTSIAASSDPTVFKSYLQAYPSGVFANLAQERIATLEARRSAAEHQAARQAREAEALAVWQSVQASDDPVLLQSVIDRYGDTIYAELASLKLESVNSRRSANVQPPAEDGSTELLFWESINQSRNRSDYQAYLDQFPNGRFAEIARDRAENGFQTAALAPAAPSALVFEGGVTGLNRTSDGEGFCFPGLVNDIEFKIENGQVAGSIQNQVGMTYGFSTAVNGDQFDARLPFGQWAPYRIRGRISGDRVTGQLYGQVTCAEFELSAAR
jgi:uncharacterized caspase-like protein